MTSERQVFKLTLDPSKISLGALSFATAASWLSIFTAQISAAQPISPATVPNPPTYGQGSRPISTPASVPPIAPTSVVQPQIAPAASKPVFQQQVSPQTLPKTQSASPSQTQERVLVTIDPGHGGKDSGAVGIDDLREVDVILPIAQKVATILREKGIEVQMTRDDDNFVGLDERVTMSRQAGATLFVSIHANSIADRPDVHGLETYHYNLGEALADTVHYTILDYFNIQKRVPLADRRVRSARFLVLRKSSIPAILVETGYLSSPTESPQLGDIRYQTIMAEAIAQGIIVYVQTSGKNSSSLAPVEQGNRSLEPQSKN
jgi:N-acetylmuramoyl-L-alanine amidase